MLYVVNSSTRGLIIVASDNVDAAHRDGLHLTQAEELAYTLSFSQYYWLEALAMDDTTLVARIHSNRVIGCEEYALIEQEIKAAMNEKSFKFLDREDLSRIFKVKPYWIED